MKKNICVLVVLSVVACIFGGIYFLQKNTQEENRICPESPDFTDQHELFNSTKIFSGILCDYSDKRSPHDFTKEEYAEYVQKMFVRKCENVGISPEDFVILSSITERNEERGRTCTYFSFTKK